MHGRTLSRTAPVRSCEVVIDGAGKRQARRRRGRLLQSAQHQEAGRKGEMEQEQPRALHALRAPQPCGAGSPGGTGEVLGGLSAGRMEAGGCHVTARGDERGWRSQGWGCVPVLGDPPLRLHGSALSGRSPSRNKRGDPGAEQSGRWAARCAHPAVPVAAGAACSSSRGVPPASSPQLVMNAHFL